MPALDLSADARAAVGATQSKAEDVGGRLLAEDAVVAMFADRTAGVSKRVRDQLPKLENNLATQHLLIRGVAALDKQALMFRAERRWPRAFMTGWPGLRAVDLQSAPDLGRYDFPAVIRSQSEKHLSGEEDYRVLPSGPGRRVWLLNAGRTLIPCCRSTWVCRRALAA